MYVSLDLVAQNGRRTELQVVWSRLEELGDPSPQTLRDDEVLDAVVMLTQEIAEHVNQVEVQKLFGDGKSVDCTS